MGERTNQTSASKSETPQRGRELECGIELRRLFLRNKGRNEIGSSLVTREYAGTYIDASVWMRIW